jgi:iron complex outermembrane receptor protein
MKNNLSLRALTTRRALRRGGASFLALTIGMAQPVFAQQTEEIVVTGIRKGIEDAIQLKRNETDIVEAISAEDIGKLPDESIADSIARLPGLAAQRNNSGRDQDISVRGLPPAMTVALLNGRQQASTSNNRDVQFDQYPSELMNQVLVYKSGDAALVGAGISTVDLRTIRPLDYGKQALTVGARGEYDTEGQLQPQGTPWGHRENITYVDQFAHDTVGLVLGYAHTDSPNEIVSQHAWGFVGNSNLPGPGGGLQNWLISDNLERDGFASTLQWKPNDRFNATVDGFYTRYNDVKLQRGIEGGINSITSASGNSESTIWSPQLENYRYGEKSTLKSVGANFDYKITDNWHTNVDLNYNSAYRVLPEIELYSGFGLNGQMTSQPITLTAPGGSGGGIIKGSGNSFSNPNIYALGENLGWANYYPQSAAWDNATGNFNTAGAGDYKRIGSKDTIREVKWDVARDFSSGAIAQVSLGVDYNDRTKSYTYSENAAYLNSLNESMPIPSGLLLSPTSLSPFGFGSTISLDPRATFDSGLYTMFQRQDKTQNNWTVEEKVTTGYVKADIDTNMFGRQVTGNVGTQIVHTDQSVLQYAQNGGWPSYTYIPQTIDTSYNDFLPSLNLIYHLTADQDIRLGVDRSIARARMDTMAGNFTVNYNSAFATSTTISPWSGSRGNPALKPWLSDDVDLSWEKYIDKDSYVSVAGYYKNLETFVYDSVEVVDFHGFVLPGLPAPALFTGPSSTYKNGNGGSIIGMELSGTLQLRKLSSALDGFGLQANVAGNYSSINIPATAGNTSPNGNVPELSKWTGSLTFFYSKNGWEARINDRYRSSYVQEVPNFDGSLQSIQGAAENIVDIQAQYSWEEGPMKGLTSLFSVQNLTNERQNSYYGNNPNQPDYYKLYGTTMLFGFIYKIK